MPIKAVLFDIDGTLVDSNDQHVLAWEEAFRREGVTFDRQTHSRPDRQGRRHAGPHAAARR
jgi:beta-phosphoglucomutase-like phosphatase (HAD superfamily)